MAGADDQATLKILVEVQEAQTKFGELVASYTAAMQKLQLATQEGANAKQLEVLRQQALAAGNALLKMADEGTAGLQEFDAKLQQIREHIKLLGSSTGTDLALGKIRDQVKGLGQESEGGGKRIDLLSAALDKAQAKALSFGAGIAAGLVLGPLIGLLDKLKDGLLAGAEAFAKYETQQIAGGESTTKLGEKTRSLTDSLERLTDRTREQREEEVKAVEAKTGHAVSTEKLVEAQKAQAAAIAKADEEYRKESAAAKSSNELLDAREKHLRATEKAQRDYNDAITGERQALEDDVEAGKKYAAQINKEQDALHAAEKALEGDRGALSKHTETLLAAIAAVEKHGEVNKTTTARIIENLKEEEAEYEKWGVKVPEPLQAVINKYKLLEEAHASAAKTLAVPLQPATGADPSAGLGDLKKHAEDLKRTVDDLNQQQLEGGLDAEGLAKLTAAQDELANVNQDLHNKTLDANKAIHDQGQEIADTRTETEKGIDVMSRYGATLDGSTHAYDSLTTGHEEFVQALQQGQQDVSDWAQEMKDAGLTVEMLAERQKDLGKTQKESWVTLEDGTVVVSNLTKKQQEESEVTALMTGEVKKSSDAWKGFADRLETTVGHVETLTDAEHLPKVKSLLADIIGLVHQAEGAL